VPDVATGSVPPPRGVSRERGGVDPTRADSGIMLFALLRSVPSDPIEYLCKAIEVMLCADLVIAALIFVFFTFVLLNFKSTDSKDFTAAFSQDPKNKPCLDWYHKHIAPQLTAPRHVKDSVLRHVVNATKDKASKIFVEFGTCKSGGFNFIVKGDFKLSVLFDSFEGFIEEWAGYNKDTISMHGQLPKLLHSNVLVAKGWFHETTDNYLDHLQVEHIDVLHIDPDAYAPSLTALQAVLKRKLIDETTVIVFDELIDVHGPGGTLRFSNIIGEECKALMEVCEEYNLVPEVLYFGHGVEHVSSEFPVTGPAKYSLISRSVIYWWFNRVFLPRTIKGTALMLKPNKKTQ